MACCDTVSESFGKLNGMQKWTVEQWRNFALSLEKENVALKRENEKYQQVITELHGKILGQHTDCSNGDAINKKLKSENEALKNEKKLQESIISKLSRKLEVTLYFVNLPIRNVKAKTKQNPMPQSTKISHLPLNIISNFL